MGAGYRGEELFYEPIDEWITGMGIMTARPG
jgi:2,3-dihydroxyphenylpropionate 1,2-dioxygenase